MTTRKHFIAKALEIAKIPAPSFRKKEAEKFAEIFAGQNPRFSRPRFFAACGV